MRVPAFEPARPILTTVAATIRPTKRRAFLADPETLSESLELAASRPCFALATTRPQITVEMSAVASVADSISP